MNFEMCGRTENEEMQKIVAPYGITTNQIEFSRGLGHEPTFQTAGVASPPALGSETQLQACVSYITLLTRAGDVC